jgi:hypothetical protein
MLFQKPIRYPINVNLVFVGFQGDGPFQFYLDEQKVKASIQSAFPMHSPHALQSNTPLNILRKVKWRRAGDRREEGKGEEIEGE